MSIDIDFDTDPRHFKEYRQKANWDCGLSTVAYFTGIPRSNVAAISELSNELGVSVKEGTDIVAIEDYFASRPEFLARANTSWTLSGIQKELQEGRECMVAYQNWQKSSDRGRTDWGHYGVIFKIENNRVYLFDPGEKKGWKIFTPAEFVERWYEVDYDRNHINILWPKWAISIDRRGAKERKLAM
jgi:ABC-type bacteriocin/lantibiotic exporter with double-glycine peptidase domain